MRMNFVNLLAIATVAFGMVSCNGSQKQKAASQRLEEEAIAVGEASREELTEELKIKVKQFMRDLPMVTLPEKLSSNEITVSLSNTDFMLPANKLTELNTMTQRARAFGMYFADFSILKSLNKSTKADHDVLLKLITSLDIPFVLDILNDYFPNDGTKVDMERYAAARDYFIDAMIENGKTEALIEMFGGSMVEYSLMYGDPTLLIKGDVVVESLNQRMEKRLNIIMEIVEALAKYYPDVQFMGKTIAPLKELVTPISLARQSRGQIEEMRTTLLN